MKLDLLKIYRTGIKIIILYSLICIVMFTFVMICRASDAALTYNSSNLGVLELYAEDFEPRTGFWGGVEYTFEIPEHESIDKWIEYYTTRGKSGLMKTLERGLIYRDFILARLEEKGLPRELLFVPFIESAYSNTAVSRAGATGLWQFMESTSERWGLEINSWVDERRDFWVATDAALEKLAYDYNYFGDWYLALAAYNFGKGGVNNLIKNTGINDYFELLDKGYLPEETARYVPKFLAIMQICSRPARYGLDISELDDSMTWERVKVKGMVDLEIVSYLSGIPLNWLEVGNAELNQSHTPPYAEEYWIKIPAMYSSRLQEVISENDFSLSKIGEHVIESGDTVYSLSNKYRVNSYLIQRSNPGIDIYSLDIGDILFIPISNTANNTMNDNILNENS
jgi:membrane-bound lytic murein transglycosylase D